jgi:hypothetical protein
MTPDPLVGADVDLKDFAFMPLDVVRLRDSDLAMRSTAEAFRAAVLLWCVSWHQSPPASLPDDDVSLAQWAGCGRDLKAWRRLREGALRGFVRCSDGRLYHPIVAEKARDAWDGKLRLRHRRECERIKKAAQRASTAPVYPTFDEWKQHLANTGTDQWVAPVPVVSPGTCDDCPEGQEDECPEGRPCAVPPLKGQGIGDRGQGNIEKQQPAQRAARFAEFWAAYPNRKGKADALAKWKSRGLDDVADRILADVKARRTSDRDWLRGFIPHGSTYINGRGWEDEIPGAQVTAPGYVPMPGEL